MCSLAELEAEVAAHTAAQAEVQTRLDALRVGPGQRPTGDAEEEMAALRMRRDLIGLERAKAEARLRQMKRETTHTLRYRLADKELATYEKIFEPIRRLLHEMRDAGVVIEWEWPDA